MSNNTSIFPYSSEDLIEAIKFDRESKLEKIRFETARMFICAAINTQWGANTDEIIKNADEFISKFDIDKL